MSIELEGWISEFDTPVDERTEWTAANIQEALPGLITPMTWTLSRPLLEYAFARPAQRVGARIIALDPFVALFYGRAFLNLTALRDGATRVPFSSPDAIDEHYLGKTRDPSASRWRPTLTQQLARLSLLPRIALVQLSSGRQTGTVEVEVEEMLRQDRHRAPSGLSAVELAAAIDSGKPLGREVASMHIGASGAASTTFGLLGHLTREWLGDHDGSLQSVLCTGLWEVESARAPRALWQLAQSISANPEVETALAAPDSRLALAELRASGSANAQHFLASYDTFIGRFGHRSVMEAELSAKAWAEDPATVLAMLRGLVASGEDGNPVRIQERQRAAREAATDRARRQLSLPRRVVFDKVLAIAQRYVATRERTKSLLIKGTHRARLLLRALGTRLADSELLERSDDVFYLTWDEARDLAHYGGGFDARERVSRRRREEDRNRLVLLPETFFGRPRPLAASGAPQTTTLKGIGVSPGLVSGVARVVLDPRTSADIAPGEILVAPVTDAGWTPLFLSAAAIVVDIGGPLSHGATVARELGLPAVVNVKQGTHLIKLGQRITVDGAAGTVLLEPAP